MDTVKKTTKVKKQVNRARGVVQRAGKWLREHKRPILVIGVGIVLASLGIRRTA